jgi:hypothetical protein
VVLSIYGTMNSNIATIYTLIPATLSTLVSLFTTSIPEVLGKTDGVIISNNTTTSNTTTTATSDNKRGNIESIQNGPDGKPEWKVSGIWHLINLNSNSPSFNAVLNMTRLDGSAAHKHAITDLKIITGNPTKANTGTSTYNGTVTISMREGPVSNVPVGINLLDNGDISIMVDPNTTDNHFGNTPIQGKSTNEIIRG